MNYRTLNGLLHSRKFLLAVFGVGQTLIFYYTNVDPEVWASIDALIVAVILGIAHEDNGANQAIIIGEDEYEGAFDGVEGQQ